MTLIKEYWIIIPFSGDKKRAIQIAQNLPYSSCVVEKEDGDFQKEAKKEILC